MADPEILKRNIQISRYKAEHGIDVSVQEHGEHLMELLTRRKEGEFQDVNVWLKQHRLEEIHVFSQTPVIIDFPPSSTLSKLRRTTSTLKMLRRKDIAQNSLEALKLISPYKAAQPNSVNIKNFYDRTLGEIEEISRLYDGFAKGTDKNKRKELRQLRDRLIIDRIIFPFVHNGLPENINVGVNLSNQLVSVRLSIVTGNDKDIIKTILIEGPDVRKYSAQRNQKLSELLVSLGEI